MSRDRMRSPTVVNFSMSASTTRTCCRNMNKEVHRPISIGSPAITGTVAAAPLILKAEGKQVSRSIPTTPLL